MSDEDFQSRVLSELDRANRALYGDGTLNGDPGLVATVRKLDAANNQTSQRFWTFGLGLFSGVLGGWLKTHQG